MMEKYDSNLWKLLKESNATIFLSTRIAILEIILETLIYIQHNGYCHLDVKPSNIFVKLDQAGNWNGIDLVIGDFGLSSSSTNLEGTCGTPGFAAPEQFMGKPSAKSDNFGFGKTAVLILFKWDQAWNLLAQPLTKNEYENHPLCHQPISDVISNLLNVSQQIVSFIFLSAVADNNYFK